MPPRGAPSGLHPVLIGGRQAGWLEGWTAGHGADWKALMKHLLEREGRFHAARRDLAWQTGSLPLYSEGTICLLLDELGGLRVHTPDTGAAVTLQAMAAAHGHEFRAWLGLAWQESLALLPARFRDLSLSCIPPPA